MDPRVPVGVNEPSASTSPHGVRDCLMRTVSPTQSVRGGSLGARTDAARARPAKSVGPDMWVSGECVASEYGPAGADATGRYRGVKHRPLTNCHGRSGYTEGGLTNRYEGGGPCNGKVARKARMSRTAAAWGWGSPRWPSVASAGPSLSSWD